MIGRDVSHAPLLHFREHPVVGDAEHPATSQIPTSRAPRTIAASGARPEVKGRFIHADGRKLYLRGVTYGTFAAGDDGSQFPPPAVVVEDFAMMAAVGVNSLRTYTPAPRWLLDLAQRQGLYVLAGLPWEEHITFLDDRAVTRSIERCVRDGVRSMAGHPALLAYSIGNEIPGGIARWHGRRPMERFIKTLYDAAKDEDPDGLVTYVNFPTTEYLQLPFVDFLSFNVYLEHRPDLKRYLARLHNIAGEKPLVMAEIGLDSRRNGHEAQAATLEWQVGTAFESGCAGAYVFAWTDDWHRGGHDVTDWDFGLVDRGRRPKPALAAVSRAFEHVHDNRGVDWPRISVAVCSHNGERWMPGCLDAVAQLHYPDYEVIVVSDGSTDATASIARAAGARVIELPQNVGLSAARNTALNAASGDIVAYLDDDARPDPDWLRYVALGFEGSGHVAVGGPNIAPPADGAIADCVANAPGGPVHVLLNDEIAEHVPGCNLAIRRDALAAIGGFDERFRIAGDDVDVCWRLQDAGGTIGFSPGAMVWHHRRNSVRTYLRQQRCYGRAEALLERKSPERYNRLGHLSWAGRIYGAGARMRQTDRGARISYGKWGTGLFQSIYEPAPTLLTSMALMPEWYLVLGALAIVSALGLLWAPLLVALPLLAGGVAAVSIRAFRASDRSHEQGYRRLPLRTRAMLRALTTALHVSQPVVRLAGRLDHGLSPLRRRCSRRYAWPRKRTTDVWSEQWAEPTEWLGRLEQRLRITCEAVSYGGPFDRWDLEARGGPFGVARVLAAVEEHGSGRQLVRLRSWAVCSRGARALAAALTALAGFAAVDGALVPALGLGALAVTVVGAVVYDCVLAAGTMKRATGDLFWAAQRASREAAWRVAEPADGPDGQARAAQLAAIARARTAHTAAVASKDGRSA